MSPGGAVDDVDMDSEEDEEIAMEIVHKKTHKLYMTSIRSQLLLLLQHVSICQDDMCLFKQLCATHKQTWKHMILCKNKDCTSANCKNFKHTLLHYYNCKMKTCEICKPVRSLKMKILYIF